MADDEGPVFPAAPPERDRAAAAAGPSCAWSADRAAARPRLDQREPRAPARRGWRGPPEPATEAGLARVFAAGEELWDRRRDFGYSIVEGPDERIVGGCGLHGRLDEHGLEIGYWVHVDRIGQGLATEVSRALTDAAFAIPGIERVRIQCDERNVRSARVPEKLGYALLGVEVPDDGVVRRASRRRSWVVERRRLDRDAAGGRLVALPGWTIARSGCSTAASAGSPSPAR